MFQFQARKASVVARNHHKTPVQPRYRRSRLLHQIFQQLPYLEGRPSFLSDATGCRALGRPAARCPTLSSRECPQGRGCASRRKQAQPQPGVTFSSRLQPSAGSRLQAAGRTQPSYGPSVQVWVLAALGNLIASPSQQLGRLRLRSDARLCAAVILLIHRQDADGQLTGVRVPSGPTIHQLNGGLCSPALDS